MHHQSTLHVTCLAFILALFTGTLCAGDAAGHWEGAITLPSASLAIGVDLEQTEGTWKGTIDIPAQGLRGFELGAVKVVGASVSFSMPKVPGDPKFTGEVSADGQSIAGMFTQGGQTFPFKLVRAKKDTAANPGSAKGIAGRGFAGVWQGAIKQGPVELRIVMKLTGNDAHLTGALTSIDQSSKEMPITTATTTGKGFVIEIKSVGATYEGTMTENGAEINGTWKQSRQTMPLVFKRLAKAPDTSRVQDPKRPYLYRDEDVMFANVAAGIRLAGTFTVPNTAGPHPAVVLLTGSGPQDRNEEIMGHRPFLVLADHLTRQGFAVLRFDDRGFGKSEGDFSKATDLDFVGDALAAVAWLKTRPEVDAARIGLAGHSEGGIVAPRAAVQSKDIAFIVLMAGVGVPMDQVLVRQAADLMRIAGAGEAMIAKQNELQRDLMRLVRANGPGLDTQSKVRASLHESVKNISKEDASALGLTEAMIDAQVTMVSSPWFAEILRYNPAVTLAQVRCPVLAVNGEKDMQVAARENLRAIEQALKKGGNPDVTVIELPGLNHLFQSSQTGAVAEYATNEETFNAKALNTVSEWLRKRAGSSTNELSTRGGRDAK